MHEPSTHPTLMKLDTDPVARRRFHDCIDAIAELEFAATPGEPTPRSYYRDRLGPPGPEREYALDKYFRYYLDVFETAGRSPHGQKVLEAGSGFGLGLVAVAVLGAAEAHGVEIVPWEVEFALLGRDVLPEDVRDRIRPVVGNAAELPYPDDTLDVVLSLEAISHYLDYEPFLDEAHRVLRPGGVLVISDGTTASIRSSAQDEEGVGVARGRPAYGHVEKPDSPFLFVLKRERIVEETDPILPPETVHDSRSVPRGWSGLGSRKPSARTPTRGAADSATGRARSRFIRITKW